MPERIERCIQRVNWGCEDDVSIPCGQRVNTSYTTTVTNSASPCDERATPSAVRVTSRTIATQTLKTEHTPTSSSWIRECNVSILVLS
jgi:hypothetical protein